MLKNFFDKDNIINKVNKVLEHRLFKPIAISIITSFILFNSVSFLKTYLSDRELDIARKYQASPIKINIPEHDTISEDQIMQYEIRPGDTMLKLLFNLGVQEPEVFSILEAMKKIYNPKSLDTGQKILIKYQIKISYKQSDVKDKNDKKYENLKNVVRDIKINQISIPASPEKEIIIRRESDDSYKASEISKKLTKHILKYNGSISSKGLFNDGIDIGISPTVMMNMVNLYSFDVDFQRDIHHGDKFEILFESFYDQDGNKVKDGNIIFSSLTLGKKAINIYMHQINKSIEYFDANGNSVRKSLLRTPINGARISSGFGMRMHPILGYSKMHKGMDFAAPSGTPILAAGNGIISYYGRKGAYGNYTRIKHNNEYSTAYAHASRFVKGLGIGSKVRQGQVVAYVGTTGRSTGAHLHYEILYKGTQINPAKVKSTSGIRLSGRELEKFKISKDQIEKYRKNIPNQNNR